MATDLTPTPETDDVLVGVRDGIAHIHLNRPKALNALTHDMCAAMLRQLREWDAAEGEQRPRAVVVSGEGEMVASGEADGSSATASNSTDGAPAMA